MTDPLECHELLLGPEAMAYVQAEAATVPPPPPELINELRRIFPQPAARSAVMLRSVGTGRCLHQQDNGYYRTARRDRGA